MSDEPILIKEPFTGLKCPSCRVDLVMSVRQDIEIDYCPKCRGIWLDRGELDKIIERSTQIAAEPVEPVDPVEPSPVERDRGEDDGSDYRQSERHGSHGYGHGHGHGYSRGHRYQKRYSRGHGISGFLHDLFG